MSYRNHSVVAIIPARGGSKSIPRKNIKLLGNAPLIAYSIAAAQESKWIDRIIVSTDDDEIAAAALEWGAEVPFRRPTEFAQDKSLDFPVFEHAIQWLAQEENFHPEVIVQLRPTSPFRPKGLVDRSIELLIDNEADSVRTITPSGQNPYKMWRIQEDGRLQPLLDSPFEEPYNMPRQALPPTFWQTGHIDSMRRSTILEQRSMTGQHIHSLPVEAAYAVDLDTLEHWTYANFLIEHRNWDIVRPIPSSSNHASI